MSGTLTPNTELALAGVVTLLMLATLAVFILARLAPKQDITELKLRVRSWWVMVAVFSIAMALDRTVSLVFLASVSVLALKEYLSLVPTRRADRPGLLWAYLAIPVQYYWIAAERYDVFIVFVPVYMLLFLATSMVLVGDTQGFLRAVATLYWGLILTVFALGHLGLLLVLPASGNPAGGGAGLLLYLVFLTQFSDVTQYVLGKLLGHRKVIPRVSPNKTWEGLLAGVATTVILAAALAPWLTPLGRGEAILAGLLIGLAGFIGDVTISAVKRDLGVKDTSTLVPGHGGILDRVDSLIFTAPLFFHLVYFAHY